MVLGEFGCQMSGVVELRPDSLPALVLVLESILAHTSKMLECCVSHALKEPSDSKEALPRVDVWRSATAIPGAQCVMTYGVLLMLMWSADSWDSVMTQVMHSPSGIHTGGEERGDFPPFRKFPPPFESAQVLK